jgi:hypothetical protein
LGWVGGLCGRKRDMCAHFPERPSQEMVCQIKVRDKRDKRDKSDPLLMSRLAHCSIGDGPVTHATVSLPTRRDWRAPRLSSGVRVIWPRDGPRRRPVEWCFPSCQNCSIKRTHWAHPAYEIASAVISALRRRSDERGKTADRVTYRSIALTSDLLCYSQVITPTRAGVLPAVADAREQSPVQGQAGPS